MIDQLIKILKKKVGDRVEDLNYIDDLKASVTSIGLAHNVHTTVKSYADSVGMVINKKKCAIQLNPETQLPESQHDIPRLVDTVSLEMMSICVENCPFVRK